jgi:hypothetical protein
MEYSKKKGVVKRMVDTIKEYYGPMPVLSGLVVAGAVSTAAFALSAIYNTSQSTANFLAGGNMDLISELYRLPENIGRIYADSRVFAASWTMPGFAVGQFAGYKLKKMIKNWFKKK